jgi:hypothetical protein
MRVFFDGGPMDQQQQDIADHIDVVEIRTSEELHRYAVIGNLAIWESSAPLLRRKR